MKSSLHTHGDKKKRAVSSHLSILVSMAKGIVKCWAVSKGSGRAKPIKKKIFKVFSYNCVKSKQNVTQSRSIFSPPCGTRVSDQSHSPVPFITLRCKRWRRNTHAPQEVIRGLRADYFASMSNNGTLSRWQLQSVRPTATFTLSASSVVIHSFARTPPIRNLPHLFEAWFWLVVHRAAGITFKYQEQKKWHLWPKCNIKVQTVMKKKPSLRIKNGEWNNSKNKLK